MVSKILNISKNSPESTIFTIQNFKTNLNWFINIFCQIMWQCPKSWFVNYEEMGKKNLLGIRFDPYKHDKKRKLGKSND